MKLPSKINEAAEAERLSQIYTHGWAEESSDAALFNTGWFQAVEWLYAYLLEDAPEFDEGEAFINGPPVRIGPGGKIDNGLFVKGARWQHQQMATQFVAMKASEWAERLYESHVARRELGANLQQLASALVQVDVSNHSRKIMQLTEERDSAVAHVRHLREALEGLLSDTQHTKHDCGDTFCPVAAARHALSVTSGHEGEDK